MSNNITTAIRDYRCDIPVNWVVVPPADLDHMPVEVAAELLSSPKARLTNRMRKTCVTARDRVFQSATPIRLFDTFRHNTAHEAEFANRPLVNLNRIRLLPIDRVARLARRASRRRLSLQRVYERAQSRLTDAQFNRVRVSLESKAIVLDSIVDAAHAELRTRADRVRDKVA